LTRIILSNYIIKMTTRGLATSALNTLNSNLVPSTLTSKIGNQKQLRTSMTNNNLLRSQIVKLFTYFKRCAAADANGLTYGRFKVPYAAVGGTITLSSRQGRDLWFYYIRNAKKSLGQVYIAAHYVGSRVGMNSEIYTPTGGQGYRL
jgi:hypothetical protein